MNNKGQQTDDYRSLLLLEEISKNHAATQRDLSKNLGVALGLINSYLKNLVSKGYVTVSAIPKNRYKYYLTPRGFSEKTRLTYQHLQNFTNLYKVARRDFHDLFSEFTKSKVRKVVFCGVDEVTEIAYLSLKEAGLELTAIVDARESGRKFFGMDVQPIKALESMDYDVIIITSFEGGEELKALVLQAGADKEKICDIGTSGWLKKIEG